MAATLRHIWRVEAALGECPTWIGPDRLLAYVDGTACSYHLLDPASGASARFALPSPVGSAAPAVSGGAVLALADGLARLDDTGCVERLADAASDGIRFNDGKCDGNGRFWIGSRDDRGDGAGLFRFDPDGGVQRMWQGFQICNGMGWSPESAHFYLVDTVPRTIYRFAFDAERGTVDAPVVFHRFDGRRGKPDGLAIDASGRLWCAMWDGGGIAVLSPEGVLTDWIEVPVARPTSCAFGGEDLRDLFVTTASLGTEGEGEAGSILQYRLDVPGVPVSLFAG